MNPEEVRIQKLIRAGRENIIKYGTYDVVKARQITQDHPFYAKPSPTLDCFEDDKLLAEPPQAMSDDDLAASIISSNFKTGLSQSEVDAILSAMNV